MSENLLESAKSNIDAFSSGILNRPIPTIVLVISISLLVFFHSSIQAIASTIVERIFGSKEDASNGIILKAGDGGSNGAGGDLIIRAGDGTNAGNGGDIYIGYPKK
jgi:hypothetical protein